LPASKSVNPVESIMNVQKPGPRIQPSGPNERDTEFEAKLRKAFDIALILAMLAAPFLLVGLQSGDHPHLAAGEAAIAQVDQVQVLAP
jgi:hypothetical protein